MCGKEVTKIRTPMNMLKPPRFCSQKCNGAFKKLSKKGTAPNVEFDCKNCGKHVIAYRSLAAQRNNPPGFCSLKCLGEYQRGNNNPAWNGGRHLQAGYYVVFSPDHPNSDCKGFVYEHRLIMEEKIGRHLNSEEVVHHINHDKTDNSPENLMLFGSQSEHLEYHAKHRGKNG
jgi:hypothetical protein